MLEILALYSWDKEVAAVFGRVVYVLLRLSEYAGRLAIPLLPG